MTDYYKKSETYGRSSLYNRTEIDNKISAIIVGKIPVNPSSTAAINIWIES